MKNIRGKIVKQARFKSRSGNGWYLTKKWENGEITCNCPGWIFKRGDAPRKCRHTIQALVWA